MKYWLLIWSLAARLAAQPAAPRPNPNPEPQTIALWEGAAPGAVGDTDADRPTLTFYRAARQPNGTAVIVAPGGGYSALAIDHEGRYVAAWLNAMGVSAFVLKYRLGPRYHHPIELGDAQRAIRLVRTGAAQFGVQADRLGMMGFSAGGHLTATAGTHFDQGNPAAADPVDRASSRPDFLILAYPVISFDPAIAHAGSVRSLLGENPAPGLIQSLSDELQVTAATPPTFLFHTTADRTVPVENSVRFYLALRAANVPAEMHLFENGPHGVGLALADPALSLWPTLLSNWLRGRGLLAK
ncbi:MAG TPA: alpha/beta hydrolase [Bryobacteraceae bacterium]|nr:alpha/beta hydrolase [Bryobacteraceae bacterium]